MIVIKLVDIITEPNTYFYEIRLHNLTHKSVSSKFVRLSDDDCTKHRSNIDDVVNKIALEFAAENNFKYEKVIYI